MEIMSHGNDPHSHLWRFVNRLGVGWRVLFAAEGEELTFWSGCTMLQAPAEGWFWCAVRFAERLMSLSRFISA